MANSSYETEIDVVQENTIKMDIQVSIRSVCQYYTLEDQLNAGRAN